MQLCRTTNEASTRRARRNRRGTTAIEFAFVAPVFFLVIFGLIECARMVMLHHALTDAARDGCRMVGLATTTDPARVETAIRNHLESTLGSTALDTSKVHVTVPSSLANVSTAQDLAVAVEVNYADASWIGFLSANCLLRAEARRKRE